MSSNQRLVSADEVIIMLKGYCSLGFIEFSFETIQTKNDSELWQKFRKQTI